MSESVRDDVALFGGSFNPPHVCHTLATLWVLQTQPIDEVWWLPTFQHAFDKTLVDFDERVEMCRLALRDINRVRIDDIERRLGGENRTVDTVRALRKDHPSTEFWLVIGADILGEVDRWKDWEGLTSMVNLVVIGRQGYDRNDVDAYGDDRRIVSGSGGLELPDVSSTLIRESLAACDYDAVRPWIPDAVLDHIDSRELYLGEDCR